MKNLLIGSAAILIVSCTGDQDGSPTNVGFELDQQAADSILPGFSVKASPEYISLTWDAVDGAISYEVESCIGTSEHCSEDALDFLESVARGRTTYIDSATEGYRCYRVSALTQKEDRVSPMVCTEALPPVVVAECPQVRQFIDRLGAFDTASCSMEYVEPLDEVAWCHRALWFEPHRTWSSLEIDPSLFVCGGYRESQNKTIGVSSLSFLSAMAMPDACQTIELDVNFEKEFVLASYWKTYGDKMENYLLWIESVSLMSDGTLRIEALPTGRMLNFDPIQMPAHAYGPDAIHTGVLVLPKELEHSEVQFVEAGSDDSLCPSFRE